MGHSVRPTARGGGGSEPERDERRPTGASVATVRHLGVWVGGGSNGSVREWWEVDVVNELRQEFCAFARARA